MHPGSARPVQNGVAAVSVLAPSCMLADAWATALTVLGAEAGAALARQLGLDVLFQLREAGGIRPVAVGRFA
jgi:thiamine biosynthesis lipoprotein